MRFTFKTQIIPFLVISMNKPSFKEWIKPFEDKCKTSNIKLSNKNRKKLNSIYIHFILNTYGNTLSNMFFAVYADSIIELVPQNIILSKIYGTN